jgi:PAS domain S-box-containing protein
LAEVASKALGSSAPLDLLDNIGCGIWVYDGEVILYANKALEELTGYGRPELLQPGFFERLMHPDDRQLIVERGHARLRGEMVPEQYEVRIIHADGAVRTLSLHAKLIGLDGRNTSVVSATDVTPLREAERTIREGTERLVAFLNAVPAHIIATDVRGKPTFVNRHWLEFTGQPLSEAMAHGTAPLIHEDDVARATEAWANARALQQPYEIEYRIRDRRGEYRWQMFRIQPVLGENGDMQGWTSVSVDIHETRQLREQLEEANGQLAEAIAAKDEVLGLISHEVRTPLTTILGNASFLQRHGATIADDARAALAVDLVSDARRLYAVIENMLVLSRSGARESAELEPHRLNHLIDAAIAEFRERSPGRLVQFEPPEKMALALVNATYYKQILGNLISNADKYSPAGAPVTVQLTEQPGFLQTTVIDRGAGIPADQIERIFAPFVRLHGHSGVAGSGLGLTVCSRLVELHGGEIGVRNVEGGGAAFWFTVPVHESDLDGEV